MNAITKFGINLENRLFNLLEKCFIVFRLNSFSRNVRNEIKKGKKIYFLDNGIRNAYCGSYAHLYFWRTHDQKEIDFIEDMDGQLTAYEFKCNDRKRASVPKTFAENYPNFTYQVINRDSFWDFLS